MSQKEALAIAQKIRIWRQEPWTFVSDVWPAFKPRKWQAEFLYALPDNLKISIRSGHSSGKSTIVSMVIIWYLVCHYPCKIPVTAPSSTQLRDVLWAEIKSWKDKMQPKELGAQIDMNSEMVWVDGLRGQATAMARTARKENPEAFQGIHAKFVLFVVDEASGIHEKIFEAGEGALATPGARLILIGNPTRTHGTFYDSHHRDRSNFYTMHVDCETVEGVDAKYIAEMKRKYGEFSDIYQYRVKGNFPKGAINQVIPLEYCESAVGREIGKSFEAEDVVWGVDVARQGKDRSALSKRQGKMKLGLTKWWHHNDIMTVTGEVAAEYRSDMKQGLKLPSVIYVDCIGFGAGVSDRLREIFKQEKWDKVTKIVDVNVSEVSTTDESKKDYWRLRDQLWFAGREWFMGEDCCIEDEPDLIGELTAPEYKAHSSGKIIVASKDEMKEILGMSPDLADSFLLTLYVPPKEIEVRLRILC